MHGVRKTARTEEQEQARKQERQRKLEVVSKGMQIVFEKLEKKVYDREGLKVSEKLLTANPDVTILWNFRRLILLSMENQQQDKGQRVDLSETGESAGVEQNEPIPINENSQESVKPMEGSKKSEISLKYDIDQEFLNELDITFRCLENNPKSYGAWHHRGWVLQRMQSPDLGRELKTCNQSLKMDERNFHCWDHRRLVCKLAGVSVKEELQFTDSKVDENFSNYSAWHYRSQLLPLVKPDPEGALPLAPDVLRAELHLATNAFYTDPEDSSAWFYCTWLFKDKPPSAKLKILAATLDPDRERVLVVLDRAHNLAKGGVHLPDGVWKPVEMSARSDYVWTCALAGQHLEKVTLELEDQEPVELTPGKGFWDVEGLQKHLQATSAPPAIREAMEKQSGDCRELAQMEPDNKWPLLVWTFCLQRLDWVGNRLAVLDNLRKLQEVDPKRKNFYADTRSRYLIAAALGQKPVAHWSELCLANLGLTTLYHTSLMATSVRHLNLAGNELESVRQLKYCLLLEVLNLEDNLLESLDGLEGLKALRRVFAARNRIASLEWTFQNGVELDLSGNPVLTKQ